MTDMKNEMPNALRCSGLSLKRSGETFCFDFTLARGELLVLVGPSGAGKAPCWICSVVSLKPTPAACAGKGRICWRCPAERPFTTLFQSNNLFDHLTVRQNIGLGLRANLRLNPAQWLIIEQAAERLGLATQLARLPPRLSGGQQQLGLPWRAVWCASTLPATGRTILCAGSGPASRDARQGATAGP